MQRNNSVTRGKNRGASAVEFALIMPLFFILLFGIVDFGWYFFNQHTLQYATREGARLALVGATLQDAVGDDDLSRRKYSIVKTIEENASVAIKPDDLKISIYPVVPNQAEPNDSATPQNAGSSGDYMRIRVLYTYKFLTPLIGKFFPTGGKVMRAEALYRNENF